MAESMPGGLNMGNVDTLSSRSSSLDKRKNLDLNSMDSHSDEHGMQMCVCAHTCVSLCACVYTVCVCVHVCSACICTCYYVNRVSFNYTT